MKKILTNFIIIYLIPAIATAQFEAGQKLIGGNVSVYTNSGNTTAQPFDNRNTYHLSATGIGIAPSIAKFSKPTVLRGIGLTYGYNKYTNKEESPDNGNGYKSFSHSAGINVFSQRFIPLGNNFFFTLQTSGMILYQFYKQTDFITKATLKSKIYGVTIALAPGLSYKINKRFLFDALLSNLLSSGYTHSIRVANYPLPTETKTHNNSFNIASSLSNTTLGNISLGFRWLLKIK